MRRNGAQRNAIHKAQGTTNKAQGTTRSATQCSAARRKSTYSNPNAAQRAVQHRTAPQIMLLTCNIPQKSYPEYGGLLRKDMACFVSFATFALVALVSLIHNFIFVACAFFFAVSLFTALLFHFSFARAGAHGLGQRTSSLLESLRGKHTLDELRTTEAR